MLLTIIENPAEVLSTSAKEVTKFDEKLATLLDHMYETMVESDGVGIAAPQVNEGIRAAVLELGEEREVLEVINPVITEYSVDTNVDLEGCLSFPGLFGEVERSNGVRVEAQDRDGNLFQIEAYDYDARVLQHEIDHLNGILFDSKLIRILTDEELEQLYAEEEE
ncbi:peptide deformylase [Kurthia zopfii]|uniref:Peptide deformylase n=1 Tax=Kurthia zopfii TaxID=1650 RepID=A0A8B4Q6P9_9BACL|nr:peptide deformylase [Kurthia zopfii]PWI22865.1 peptide deformylase [Kurthia zopfii]TDR40171.1 peptide deformylase [Kurthia zopfii]GEK30244.1 peptide deformylase [Kurthia zopfii]STX09029.1 Peptide deformylase 1 [Kurthia zopfii]